MAEWRSTSPLYYGWRDKLLEGGRAALAGKEERTGEKSLAALSVLVLVLASVAAAAASGAAAAQSGWTPPQSLAAPSFSDFVAPGLSFDAQGDASLAWIGTTSGGSYQALVGRKHGAQPFTEVRTMAALPVVDESLGGGFALFGRARFVYAGRSDSGLTRSSGAQILFGSLTSKRSRVTQLGTAGQQPVESAISGVSATGKLAVLIVTATPAGQSRSLYLSVGSTNGRFSRPRRLRQSASLGAVAVAIDNRGDVLAGWQHNDKVEAVWRAGNGRMGAIRAIGSTQPNPSLSVATGARGQGAILWESQLVVRGNSAQSPTAVFGATSTRLGRFGPAHQLDGFSELVPLGQCGTAVRTRTNSRLSFNGLRPIAVWTGRSTGRFVIRAAPLDLASAAPQTLSAPSSDACLGSLAADRSGSLAVTWEQGDGNAGQVEVATRTPTGAFGQAAAVPGATAGFAAPVVAVDPTSRRPLVAWATSDGQHLAFSQGPPLLP